MADLPAFRALKRAIQDRAVAHPLAAWLTDNMPDFGAFDAIGALVADHEAEGSALIGAKPCLVAHGIEWPEPGPDGRALIVPLPSSCPACGAAV